MCYRLCLWIFIIGVLDLGYFVDSCGIITHLMIGHRAKENFKHISTTHNYREFFDKHQGAFFAGNAYPDAFEICAGGRYKDVGEDSHWAPFLKTAVDFIQTLPKPWDNSTEQLITFLFGISSHQVSDILWESSGIDQGFVSALANLNFHGSMSEAMKAADLGGDSVNSYQSDLFFLDFFDDPEWYVPSKDLANIYQKYYGSSKITSDVIENCTTLQLVYAAVERLGIVEIYPEVAKINPFLVDHVTDYFIGGIDDMTLRSQLLWNDLEVMLENGTNACTIPKNTLFITCDNSSAMTDKELLKHHHYTYPNKYKMTSEYFKIEKRNRGIVIRLTGKMKDILRKQKSKSVHQKRRKSTPTVKKSQKKRNMFYPPTHCLSDFHFGTYEVNNSYSNFGWSLAVKDINGDGNDDMIVGAPKYSPDTSSGQGRVYLLYGSDNGFLTCDYDPINVDQITNFTSLIRAPLSKTEAGFGWSVATLDINLDGKLDIIVGAPFTGKDVRQYNGAIYIYFGQTNNRDFGEPNITIGCETKYCNLGYTLAVADINFDGKDDLVIGTPFYEQPNPQTGIVSGLVSESSVTGMKYINFEDLLKSWKLGAKQAYGWFGHKIKTKYDVLMVNQPYYRLCARSDCNISSNDIQGVGRLNTYNMGSKVEMTNFTFTGFEEFQAMGYSSDLGYPYDDNTLILAVGIPGASVNGSILTIPFVFPQAGMVILYNMTSTQPTEVARFEANRHYSRFGALVKFDDVNGDSIDDLIVSSPDFTTDWTDLLPEIGENGLVYVYNGGKQFPTGNVSRKNCSNEAIVTPCTKKGFNTLEDNTTEKNRAGYNVEVVKTKRRNYLVFSEPFSSDDEYGSRSGRLYLHFL